MFRFIFELLKDLRVVDIFKQLLKEVFPSTNQNCKKGIFNLSLTT